MLLAAVTFAAAGALLIVLPGPDNALVVRNALRYGRGVALRTAAGTLTGVVAWIVAAALGLSALLAASRIGDGALRLLGAAYLAWLGVQSLRSRGRLSLSSDRVRPPARRGAAGYAMGVVTNLANPKTGVFFIALFPAFIPRGSSPETASLLLGAIFVLETAIWFAILLRLVSRAGAWLQRPRVQRRVERISGVVLIAFAVRVATERR